MVHRKQSSKRPQAKHKSSRQSQFDKRERLNRPNPDRKTTGRARVPLVGALKGLARSMSAVLDVRIAFRLSVIMAGMMLADDRRVAAAWFAAAGVRDD